MRIRTGLIEGNEMQQISICKAEGHTPNDPVEDLQVMVTESIPKFDFKDDTWENQTRDFYDDQATKLVDVFVKHLPGGTVDALLRELCKRKACLFRVPINS